MTLCVHPRFLTERLQQIWVQAFNKSTYPKRFLIFKRPMNVCGVEIFLCALFITRCCTIYLILIAVVVPPMYF
nr:hypothetical protein [Tanacetum cinerariifolium]